MPLLGALSPEEDRFFDGGDDSVPPDPAAKARFEFVWDEGAGGDRFRLRRRIGYGQRQGADKLDRRFVVPRDLGNWRTDFASVPGLFGWLVPRAGDHLPAAIIHDALVEGPSSYIGPEVARDEADLVFKEAMADLGTGVVRRWLVWTAVTLATIGSLSVGPRGSRWRWYYFVIALGTLLTIVYCGAQASFDLLGVGVRSRGVQELPWMRGGTLWADLWRGVVGAVVVPALLASFWGRFWRAGIIAGVALAFLLHVTALIAILTVVYLGLEKLGRVNHGRVLLVLVVGFGFIAGVLFVFALT